MSNEEPKPIQLVFYLSDRTAITVETLGNSVLNQFKNNYHFVYHTIPFINNLSQAYTARNEIKSMAQKYDQKPLIFHTLTNTEIKNIINECHTYAILVGFWDMLIQRLEKSLQSNKKQDYDGDVTAFGPRGNADRRIKAINYTLNTDDGLQTKRYNEADVILLGPSRAGKTPTSLFLALQYNLRVANYPLSEEDYLKPYLSSTLKPYKKKLIGLTIDYALLSSIRQERFKNSNYAHKEQCKIEIKQIEKLYNINSIMSINTSNRSIESISSSIMAHYKKHINQDIYFM